MCSVSLRISMNFELKISPIFHAFFFMKWRYVICKRYVKYNDEYGVRRNLETKMLAE
jgi:hypothetical protein